MTIRQSQVSRRAMPPDFGGGNPIPSLPGLQFYVDRLVALPTLSGSDVTAWNDLSSSANNLTQTTANKPQWVAGAGVRFTMANSTAIWRPNVDIFGSGAFTMAAVIRFDATTGTDQAMFGNIDIGNGGVCIAYSDAGVCWQCQHIAVANEQDNTGGAGTQASNPPTGQFVVVTLRRPAGSNEDWRVNDGAHTFSGPTNSVVAAGATSAIIMGARNNAGASRDQFASCTIAAKFISNQDIGTAKVSQVVAYWRRKYSI